MSKPRDPHELVCQAPKRRPFGRTNAVHGKRLSRVDRPVRPTRRLLRDLSDVREGCTAAWCDNCGVASEYEYVDQSGQAA